jgi:MFS family permease
MHPAELSLAPPTKVRYLVLAALCLAALIAYVHRSCIAVPAAEIQRDLSLSDGDLSLVMSAFFFGYTLFQLPGGWLGDRWGTRLALTVFAVWWSLCTGLMGLASGFELLFLFWLANGMGQAGIFPCAVNAISRWFPASERGFPSGMLGSFMSVGAVLASALTGFLLEYLDWPSLFELLAVPGIVFAVAFYVWFRNRPGEHPWVNEAEVHYAEMGTPMAADESRASGSNPAGYWPLILVCGQQFFRAAAYIFYVTWYPGYLQKSRGVSLAASGLLTSLPLVGVIVGSSTSGLVIDWLWRRTASRRLSRQGVGLSGVLAAGGFLVLAALAEDLAVAVALITASATCAGFAGPAGYTTTIDLAGPRVATVFSIMNMAGNLGATLCPLVVGHLIEENQWAMVLFFLAGLYGAAGACWSFLATK